MHACLQQAQQQQQQQQDRLWVLKENTHRGQGVLVVPEVEAIAIAGGARPGGSEQGPEMVQAYLGEQLTIAGRRFYLRCIPFFDLLLLIA